MLNKAYQKQSTPQRSLDGHAGVRIIIIIVIIMKRMSDC